jgi:hypothetical protein
VSFKPWTWFESIRHGIDYLVHMAMGRNNLGPFGISPRSEKLGTELVITL